MNNTATQQGLAALKTGDKKQAKQLFSKALSQDKQDVQAWLGLSLVIDDKKKQRICLQRVLELEPGNRYAKKWLARLDEPRQEIATQQNKLPSKSTSSDKRFSLASMKRALLGEPHLPLLPILLIILLLMTDMFFMLIGQPTGYWHDFGIGSVGNVGSANLLSSAMRSNPIWFVLLMIGYTAISTLLLRFLAYVPAFILWMMIFSVHLQSVIKWLRCSLWRSFQMDAASCSAVGFTSLVVIAVIMGTALAMVLWPRGTAVSDTRAQKQRKPSSWMFVAVGMWVFLLIIWLGYRVSTPVDGWLPVTFDYGPIPRVSTAIAYDSDRQRAVLFGGGLEVGGSAWNDRKMINDTWEWDGNNWIEKFPENPPSPRFSHQMAYDPIRKVTVLFGGESEQETLGDTWEWDGENWHLRSSSVTPPIRCCSSLFFDPQRGKVILTSGFQPPEDFLADVWEWDGQIWQLVETPSPTPQISAYQLAYHDERNQAVALIHNQTWLWDSVSWNYSSQSLTPYPQNDSSMAYDSEHAHIVLYGGCGKDKTDCAQGETWIYDGSGWHELTLSQGPSDLTRHTLFYDQKRERVMIFGGFGSGAVQNLMWELHFPEE